MNRKAWFHLFLVGFFLATCFTYIHPLLVPLLADAGLAPRETALLQSFSLLVAVFALPYLGRALDRGNYRAVVATMGLSVLVGLIPFAVDRPSGMLLVFCVPTFVIGVSTVSIAVARFTEGLAPTEELPKASSLTYLASNSAMGISGVLGYLFIDDYKRTLLALDAVSTTGLAVFLLFAYSALARRGQLRTAPHSPSAGVATFFRRAPAAAAIVILLFMTLYAHVSAVPLLFLRAGMAAKSALALLLIANTFTVVVVSWANARWKFTHDRTRTLWAVVPLASVGLAVCPFWLTPAGIVITTITWSAAEALAYPLSTQIVLSYFRREDAGMAVATRDLLLKSALILAPLAGGVLIEISPISIGIFFGLLPWLAALIYYRFRNAEGWV